MNSLNLFCQALIFDLDGTLVDSRASLKRAWYQWADFHAIPHAQVDQRDRGKMVAEVIHQLAPDLDQAKEALRLSSFALNDLTGVSPTPGAVEFIQRLPLDFPWSVATGSVRPLALALLDHCGFPAPPFLISAEDVGRGKPAPDAFLKASQAMHQNPADCLVIEDTPVGIKAASAAFMESVALGTTNPQAAFPAGTHYIPALTQLGASLQNQGVLRLTLQNLPLHALVR